MNTIERFEKLAEQLIEGTFERLFKPQLHPADLAKALAQAMEQGLLDDGRGNLFAPHSYQVFLNPTDYQLLYKSSNITAEVEAIQRYLTGLMTESGCRIKNPLQVSIQPQSNILPGKISVIPHWS